MGSKVIVSKSIYSKFIRCLLNAYFVFIQCLVGVHSVFIWCLFIYLSICLSNHHHHRSSKKYIKNGLKNGPKMVQKWSKIGPISDHQNLGYQFWALFQIEPVSYRFVTRKVTAIGAKNRSIFENFWFLYQIKIYIDFDMKNHRF